MVHLTLYFEYALHKLKKKQNKFIIIIIKNKPVDSKFNANCSKLMICKFYNFVTLISINME